MNLLLPNVREDTAYLLVRCLQAQADKIILAVDGESWKQRWTGMARYSRYVSGGYRVPDPARDWWAGTIQKTNTSAEECYIREIEKICRCEAIDVIFPSFDPEMYVFAKNSERFAQAGISVVTPPLENVLTVQDKSRVLQVATATGFPAPLTCYPESVEELDSVMAAITPPWVLKPRFSAHGADIELAETPEQLREAFQRLSAQQPAPLVQEFILGGMKQNFYMIADRDSRIVSVFSPQVTRVRREGVRTATAACLSRSHMPYLDEVQALVSELSLTGGFTLQTQLDPRDDSPRLMEINPRLGHNVWFRTELGVPEPSLLVKLALGEELGEVPAFPEGYLLVDPLIDVMHLLREIKERLVSLLSGKVATSETPVPRDSVRRLLKAYRADYLGGKRIITSPLSRGYLSDPLPPLSRVARQLLALLRRESGSLR